MGISGFSHQALFVYLVPEERYGWPMIAFFEDLNGSYGTEHEFPNRIVQSCPAVGKLPSKPSFDLGKC